VLAARRDRLAQLVVLAGTGFALLAVVATCTRLLSTVLRFASTPAAVGFSGLAVLVLGSAALVVALAVGVLIARSRLTDGQILLTGLALLLVVRLVSILVIDSPIAPDASAYQKLAVSIMREGFLFHERPTGYPLLLAGAYLALDKSHLTHELLNLGFAIVGGVLLFDLARRWVGRQAALMAMVAYAIVPGLLFLTPVRLVDTVFATAVIAVVWAVDRAVGGSLAWATLAGLLIAASQYIRPVGPLLLAALALALLLTAASWRRGGLMVATMTLAFVVGMLPVINYNLTQYGDLSPSTSAYGGWSLYVGANQASNGGWNKTDADFVRTLPGPFWDQSGAVGRLGMQRITDDPIGFAGLAVRKFSLMWGTEHFTVQYAMDFRQVGGMEGAEAGVLLLSEVAWLSLLLAVSAALLMSRRQRRPRAQMVILLSVVLAEFMLHIFVEVKPRYHAHLDPILILIAIPAIARWMTAGWDWRDIVRGAPEQAAADPGGAGRQPGMQTARRAPVS
jgi:Dolichyl-phosphate-mannose-protein mannosyltransferase